jgi:dTMP kinase
MNILKNFMVFEGLDGAGTTTQSKLLVNKIPNSIFTNEPSGNAIGTLIRKCLKHEIAMNPKTLTYLFASDRAEHLFGKNGVVENCNENKIVICDRYLFSSIAYQALDNDFDLIVRLNQDFPMPEVVFFLNTSIDECQKRIGVRGESEELFEKRNYQEKILANYLKSFEYYKDRTKIITLNGDLAIEELLNKEIEVLKSLNIIS